MPKAKHQQQLRALRFAYRRDRKRFQTERDFRETEREVCESAARFSGRCSSRTMRASLEITAGAGRLEGMVVRKNERRYTKPHKALLGQFNERPTAGTHKKGLHPPLSKKIRSNKLQSIFSVIDYGPLHSRGRIRYLLAVATYFELVKRIKTDGVSRTLFFCSVFRADYFRGLSRRATTHFGPSTQPTFPAQRCHGQSRQLSGWV